MSIHSRLTIFITVFLIGFTGISALYSQSAEDNYNYYLGVLAKGYPNSLVVSEFKYANARIVSIKDNMVLFGIDENTKLTTFFKNLPFLKEVYVDIQDLKGEASLKKNPLVREFLFLKQKSKNPKIALSPSKNSNIKEKTSAKTRVKSAPHTPKTLEKASQKPAKGNKAKIDQLIREKAKKIRTKQGVEK